jgi:membrane fusion protein (multidrug efflux system)
MGLRLNAWPDVCRAGISGLIWLAITIVLTACHRAAPPPPKTQLPEVTVAVARRANVPVTVELPGRTSAYRIAQVRTRVDGIVLKREFKEGSDVKANQRLYQIDPAPYQAAFDNAAAALGKAKANLVAVNEQAIRYKQLVAKNAVSKQDYDNALSSRGQAVADVDSAKASLQTAKINLGYTNVTAPITGRAGISAVTEGAYVQGSAATLMTTIQQIDPIYVDLNQSSVEGLRLRRDIAEGKVKMTGPNQAKVTVFLEDGTQYPVTGVLQFTDITVDPNTGSVTVRVLVPNPHYILLPGMFVRARVDEGIDENALLVPQVGITHNPQGQATALVVGPDNKVVMKIIQATRTFGTDWVVTSGLQEGDKVIVSGVQKVKPGAQVKVVENQAASASEAQGSQVQPGGPAAPAQ